jgi:O-antigen ligase
LRRTLATEDSLVIESDTAVLDWIRVGLVALGAVGTVVALPGLLAHELFRQPTLTKYIVSVLAPLSILLVGALRHPLRLVIGAIIVCAPIGTEAATFSGVSTPLQAVLVGLGVAVAVFMTPLKGRLSPTAKIAVVVVVLLIEPTLAGTDGLFNVVWIAAILTTGWLVSLVASEPGGGLFVCGALVASALIQAIIAIYEYKTGHLINLYGSAGAQSFGQDYFFTFGTANRPVGLFNDPNSFGNVLALALPLCVYVACSVKRLLLKVMVAMSAVAIAVGLTLSLSRMSWVGGAVGVVVTLVLLPGGQRQRATFATLVLAAAAIAAGSASLGLNLSQRAETILHPTSGANSNSVANPGEDVGRTRIWGAALSIFAENPIVGVGLNRIDPLLARKTGGITQYSQAQSVYFQVLAEAGICGGLALVLTILAVTSAIVRGIRVDRRLAAGLAGSFIAILLGWTTDYTVHQISVGSFVAVIFGLAAFLAGATVKPPAQS